MKTVLVIDSKSDAANFVARMLQKRGYHTLIAPVGTRLSYAILTPPPDLVLLNADSALRKGTYAALTDACDYASAIGTPLLLLTRRTDAETIGWAVSCGVSDYVSLVIPNPPLLYAKVAYWVERRIDKELERGLPPNMREALLIASSVMSDLCVSARCGEGVPFGLIRKNSLTIIDVLKNSQAMKAFAQRMQDDADLVIHLMRTASYAGWLAAARGYAGNDFMYAVVGGATHDTGKVFTPHNILYSTEKLAAEEWKIMQRHPGDSAKILTLTEGVPEIIAEIGGNHHEKIDGTGYPRGLSGAQISELVRIVAIADAYDARTSRRSYNIPEPKEVALEKLRYPAGHLDPELLKLFTEIILEHQSPLSAARSPSLELVS